MLISLVALLTRIKWMQGYICGLNGLLWLICLRKSARVFQFSKLNILELWRKGSRSWLKISLISVLITNAMGRWWKAFYPNKPSKDSNVSMNSMKCENINTKSTTKGSNFSDYKTKNTQLLKKLKQSYLTWRNYTIFIHKLFVKSQHSMKCFG